ncbi:MAG: hypothetical protein F4029_05000 [Gammaproteobacteria bacterium]|nr:hypothetical protein [Gammaproteobacteria bacterium]MYK45571.1 hypothetical protein [Gammaproteobacteria bacterium]
MAVAEVASGAAQRVVVVAGIEGDFVGEGVHDDGEPLIEVDRVAAAGFAFEPSGALKSPDEDRRTVR